MPRYHVVFNARSGTALTSNISPEMIRDLFEANGLTVELDADMDAPFETRIERAVQSDADIVVAAGGDGTVTGLAEALAGTDKALAILPLGTVNALARDLNIPLDLPGSVAALTSANRQHIDIGEVNGRIFLHKVVIGVIPSLAAAREHIRGQGTWASKFAFMRFLVHRLARSKRMAVGIEPEDGESHVVRAKAVAVACNAYDQGIGRIFAREDLATGHLTIYTLSSLTIADFVRLSAGMVLGNWQESPALSIETSKAVTIHSRKKLLKVMFDGEVETLHTPLHFRLKQGALAVMAPTQAQDQVAA